jgi:hypothetical protein
VWFLSFLVSNAVSCGSLTGREEHDGICLGTRAHWLPLLCRRQEVHRGPWMSGVAPWRLIAMFALQACQGAGSQHVDTCDESGCVHGTNIDAMRRAPRPLTCRESTRCGEVTASSSSLDCRSVVSDLSLSSWWVRLNCIVFFEFVMIFFEIVWYCFGVYHAIPQQFVMHFQTIWW